MTKSIRLRKPIMVEGKIISKGAKILVESEDIEDVGMTTNPSDNIDYDMDKARRLARIRKLRAMKKAEAEVVDADENDEPVDFPADDIQALRRARMAKIRKIRAMKMRNAKKSEDELDEDETLDEDEEETKVDALRKARLNRIRKIRAMKKAEDETLDEDEDDGVVADKCGK